MRRWISVMAVSALVAGLVVIGGSPASASVDDCPMGYVCLFEHSDARGTMVKFTANQNASDLSRYLCPVSHCWHGGANFNDDMSSWVNNSGVKFCWYFDKNYQPYYGSRGPRPMPPEAYRVVNLTSFENDQASSLHRSGLPGC
jgi:Peptidase inhibitor family I36